MRELTLRQKQVLNAIREHILQEGYPPSVREIGERLGVRSSCTVQRHLEALTVKGYLRRDGSKARTLEIVNDRSEPRSRAVVAVPVVGRVAAGLPLLAEEHIETHLPLGRDLVGDGAVFALRVRGDSMIEAGLFDGDTVVVRQQGTANNGDIVVALVDGGEATVKRFYRDNGRIRLQPANSAMEPIYPEQVEVLGRVMLSIRRF